MFIMATNALEICGIEMMSKAAPAFPISIEMNLRLWSDTQPLVDLLTEFPGPPEHLHRKDEMIQMLATGRPYRPRRHYAAFRPTHTDNPSTIETWLGEEITKLHRRILTSELIRMGVVEAVFWVAIIGDKPITSPVVSAPIVERLRAAGARALIENYTPPASDTPAGGRPTDGQQATERPTKTWYPHDENR